VFVLVVACLALSCMGVAGVSTQVRRLSSQPVSSAAASASPYANFPHQSLLDFHDSAQLPGEDPFMQVRSVIGSDADISAAASTALESTEDVSAFLEMQAGVGKVRSFCEICILVMQMKERGQPHLCAGLNTNYHITCIETLESILRADKAVVYWLKNGCMHMDSEGPEIVRPCPAINICSWVPNLFADAPSLVRDGVDSMCPKDPKWLPTIPQEFRNLLGATDHTAADTSATDGPVDPTVSGA